MRLFKKLQLFIDELDFRLSHDGFSYSELCQFAGGGDGASQDAMDSAGLGEYGPDPDHDGINNNHDWAGNTIKTEESKTTEQTTQATTDEIDSSDTFLENADFDTLDYVDYDEQKSYHTDSFLGVEYSYDIHYHDDGRAYGKVSEAISDLGELSGIGSLDSDVAKGIDTLSDLAGAYFAANLGIGGLGIFQAGMKYDLVATQLSGALISYQGFSSAVDNLTDIGTRYGLKNEPISIANNYNSSHDRVNSIYYNNLRLEQEQYRVKIQQATKNYDSDIDVDFEWQPGGEFYNANAGTYGYRVSTTNEPNQQILNIDTRADKLYDEIALASPYINYT
jgi:hypothetical protein